MQILFYLFYSIFAVPFKALTYEMTPDYNERNRVMAYVAFFHKSAEFLYEWIIPFAAVISSAYFAYRLPAGSKVEMTGVIIVTWMIGLNYHERHRCDTGFVCTRALCKKN